MTRGFGAEGFGFGFWVLDFGVEGSSHRRVYGPASQDAPRFEVPGLGLRDWGLEIEFEVQGAGVRVSGFFLGN